MHERTVMIYRSGSWKPWIAGEPVETSITFMGELSK
jgi:hypothetical protein